MSKEKAKKNGRVMWGFIYTGAFIAAFAISAAIKLTCNPLGDKYTVHWDETIGNVYTDLSYGDGEANKFDLYVPAGGVQETYGLVVYLHAGGFTSGDKSGDAEILKWLCSQGYVAAGINYTLFNDENPNANIYTQSRRRKSWATSWTGWLYPAARRVTVWLCCTPIVMLKRPPCQ